MASGARRLVAGATGVATAGRAGWTAGRGIGQHAPMGNIAMSLVSALIGGGMLYLAIDGRQMSNMARRRRARGIPPMETANRIGFGIGGVFFLVGGLISLFG